MHHENILFISHTVLLYPPSLATRQFQPLQDQPGTFYSVQRHLSYSNQRKMEVMKRPPMRCLKLYLGKEMSEEISLDIEQNAIC